MKKYLLQQPICTLLVSISIVALRKCPCTTDNNHDGTRCGSDSNYWHSVRYCRLRMSCWTSKIISGPHQAIYEFKTELLTCTCHLTIDTKYSWILEEAQTHIGRVRSISKWNSSGHLLGRSITSTGAIRIIWEGLKYQYRWVYKRTPHANIESIRYDMIH